MRIGVKGWSPKIDIHIFEEPKNQRVFLDLKVYKKLNIIQRRLCGHAGVHFGVKGCFFVHRVGGF